MSAASRLYPLSFLAALVLAGCSSQPSQPLKKGKNLSMWQAWCARKCPPA